MTWSTRTWSKRPTPRIQPNRPTIAKADHVQGKSADHPIIKKEPRPGGRDPCAARDA